MDLRRIRNLYSTFLNHLEWNEWEQAGVIALHLCDVLDQCFDDSTMDRIRQNLKSDRESISRYLGSLQDEHILKELPSRFDFYISLLTSKKPNIFFLRFKKIIRQKSLLAVSGAIFILAGFGLAIHSWSLRNNNWLGHYFSDMEFKNLTKVRRDPGLQFNWGYSAPFLGFRGDQFSVRWTGYLKCQQSGDYSFRFEVDDGVRFWINDILWLDAWTKQAPHVKSVKLFLPEGHHKIKVEYFEIDSFAGIQMKWKTPGATVYSSIPRKNIKEQLAP